MKEIWKNIQKALDKKWRMMRTRMHNQAAIKKWIKAGRPYPVPHEYVQETLKKNAGLYGLDILVETGMGTAGMVYAMYDYFSRIVSIEADIDRYLAAKEKFHDMPQVEIIKGHSEDMLLATVDSLTAPALFWINAPEGARKGAVNQVLESDTKIILRSKYQHVILISDARLFTGANGFPAIVAFRNYIAGINPACHFEVEHDIIKIWQGATDTTADSAAL